MNNVQKYVGMSPVGVSAQSGLAPLTVFEINDETAVTAYHCGDDHYKDFAETEIRSDEGGRFYIERYAQRYYLDEIVRTGTPWLLELPACKGVRI